MGTYSEKTKFSPKRFHTYLISVDNKDAVPDPQLVEYINTVEKSTKLDFINGLKASTSNENVFETNGDVDWKHFDNTYYEFDRGEIVLSNVRLISEPKPHMTESNPDFLYGSVDTTVKWEPAILEATYELNQKPNEILNETISNSGLLRLMWNNVEAKGYFTFNPAEKYDGFSSTNYALNFVTKDAKIMFVDRQHVPIDGRTLRALGKKLGHLLQDNLFWKLRSKLREKIDRFLINESVDRFFDSKHELVVQYETFITENNYLANSIIDGLLNMLRNFLKEAGLKELPIPAIRREFSKKFAFINFWGYLELTDGSVGDIDSLKRMTTFSLVIKSGVFHIAGVLEFLELTANFPNYKAKIWNIGPSGKILAKVGRNSFDVNLVVKPDANSMIGFQILENKFKINLENFKISATGLTVVLDWLLSIIVTTVANCFTGEIAEMVEEEVENFLYTLN